MDFLFQVKKRIEEMEEQARLLREMESEGFASQGRRSQEGAQRSRKSGKGKNKKQANAGSAPWGQPTAPQGRGGRSLVSQEEVFQTPDCVQVGQPRTSGSPSGRPQRLWEGLHGRLDEAFLLSEILGPPRCVRGWDDG
jgi:hypothetical protein